jgi:hypothetical protein
MADTTVSSTAVWDTKYNDFVTTTVLESLTGWPTPTSAAYDVQKSVEGGVYRISYKSKGDATPSSGGSGGGGPAGTTYAYEIHATTSTEPLLTHPIFGPAGSYELSTADLDLIKSTEATGQWAAESVKSSNSDNFKKYAGYRAQGTDSYVNPGVTLSITTEESQLPPLTAIGTIQTVSNAPTLPSGANWLLMGMTAVAAGPNKWRISREYRSSGRKGWDTSLYAATA